MRLIYFFTTPVGVEFKVKPKQSKDCMSKKKMATLIIETFTKTLDQRYDEATKEEKTSYHIFEFICIFIMLGFLLKGLFT